MSERVKDEEERKTELYCFNSRQSNDPKNLQLRVTRPSARLSSNDTHPHLDFGGVDGVTAFTRTTLPRERGVGLEGIIGQCTTVYSGWHY